MRWTQLDCCKLSGHCKPDPPTGSFPTEGSLRCFFRIFSQKKGRSGRLVASTALVRGWFPADSDCLQNLRERLKRVLQEPLGSGPGQGPKDHPKPRASGNCETPPHGLEPRVLRPRAPQRCHGRPCLPPVRRVWAAGFPDFVSGAQNGHFRGGPDTAVYSVEPSAGSRNRGQKPLKKHLPTKRPLAPLGNSGLQSRRAKAPHRRKALVTKYLRTALKPGLYWAKAPHRRKALVTREPSHARHTSKDGRKPLTAERHW